MYGSWECLRQPRTAERRMRMRKTIKKTVVLEAYVQTSYDSYTHIFKTVEIEIPDDEIDWHVCGEMEVD